MLTIKQEIKKKYINENKLKKSKSFYSIFFVELWERFGYYGLQGILAVYLVKIIGLSESESIILFSSFSALVYGFVSIGGWLGDKILGTKRVIILGMLVLIIGYTIITFSNNKIDLIYLGMATIAVGNGLFKANPSSLLSTIYKRNDSRLESAFTLYYMSINIGSFISMLITPWLVKSFSWNVAFSLSIFGMLIALLIFLFFYPYIKNYGSLPDFTKLKWCYLFSVLIGIIFLIAISTWLLKHKDITLIFLGIIIFFIFSVLIYETKKLDKMSRQCMLVAFIMMLESIVFFILYGQTPTSLNFFAIHNVEHTLLGFNFEPEQFQALNPFWIICFSPLLAFFYNRLGNRLPMTFKFSIGMMFCSFSFLILFLGTNFANNFGIVSIYWLILNYALQSIGELMISGLGLAMVAKLVPKKLMGFVMGAWFSTTSVAVVISGHIANFSAIPTDYINNTNYSLQIYSNLFMKIGIFSAFISFLMLIFSSKLNCLFELKKKNN